MFDLSQTVLLASFAFCFLCLIVAIPLTIYLRKGAAPSGWNYGGLVRIESLGNPDLFGMGLLLFLYTLLIILPLPQVTEWLVSLGLADAKELDRPKEINVTPSTLVAGMISQMVPGIIVITFLVFRRIHLVEFFGLRWSKAPFLLLIGPIVAVGTQMLFMIMEFAGYTDFINSIFDEIETQEIMRVYQDNHQYSIRILIAVMAVIIAPIVEEVVFRGYIYAICKRHTGRIMATFVTSLFFAAIHFNIPALLPLFIFAIFLTIAYEVTGSIWVPISIHACFNAITLIVQALHPSS